MRGLLRRAPLVLAVRAGTVLVTAAALEAAVRDLQVAAFCEAG